MNTFHSARLKLTGWYLIIIMVISVIFSLVVYSALGSEFYRFETALQSVIESRPQESMLQRAPDGRRMRIGEPITSEFIAKIKQRFLFVIIAINAGILVTAGGLGYFLAGRTLRPIRDMMDEQNRFITDASHELKTPLTALRSEFEIAMLDGGESRTNRLCNLSKAGMKKSSDCSD
jgi:signal transduction histidine kinase